MEIVALASDHRGYEIKTKLIRYLRDHGYMPLDVGTNDENRCDAQDYAVAAALTLRDGRASKAILICGSGNMIAMAANRFPEVRAAICPHVTAAKMARLHNDANAICFGADFMGYDLMKECIEVFLTTEFLGGRYGARVERLTKLDPKTV